MATPTALTVEHLELARKGLLGSTLNVRGARRVNELQRAAVEQSRLKIPLSGFNDLNGVPASANRWTLTDVLRGEWRFDGLVVSD